MSSSFDAFEKRKSDHISLALDARTQSLVNGEFDRVSLTHIAIPEFNFDDISLSTELLGQTFRSPHFISSMTAGHKESEKVNFNLAKAANENGWLMAVGSQRRELTDTSASQEWIRIKNEFPNLGLVSNVGVLEVNESALSSILALINNINAIGIYIHLNPLQEVFQQNQNLNFRGVYGKIKELVKESPVPVLVKEVGFGVNSEVAKKLFDIGVQVVDVAGSGGTHWAKLEALRHSSDSVYFKMASAFDSWGQSAVRCLLNMQNETMFHHVWASGGIRSGVDSAKCLALGARAVGVAQPLMVGALESDVAVSNIMRQFDLELKTAMFCTGVVGCKDFLRHKVWYETGY